MRYPVLAFLITGPRPFYSAPYIFTYSTDFIVIIRHPSETRLILAWGSWMCRERVKPNSSLIAKLPCMYQKKPMPLSGHRLFARMPYSTQAFFATACP